MYLIKIEWCHSLFLAGKEQVTSEFPRGSPKKCWDNNLYKEKWFFIFNNYSPKAKLILLNNSRDEVEGIIQQYSLSPRWIIVLVYSHEVISTESERKPLKND